jgi:hypothetical protein
MLKSAYTFSSWPEPPIPASAHLRNFKKELIDES